MKRRSSRLNDEQCLFSVRTAGDGWTRTGQGRATGRLFNDRSKRNRLRSGKGRADKSDPRPNLAWSSSRRPLELRAKHVLRALRALADVGRAATDWISEAIWGHILEQRGQVDPSPRFSMGPYSAADSDKRVKAMSRSPRTGQGQHHARTALKESSNRSCRRSTRRGVFGRRLKGGQSLKKNACA